MGKIIKNLPIVLLALAIGFSPSLSVGTFGSLQKNIEIRIEDILILILGLVWIANFLISGRKKIEKPPLLKPILVWLGVGFFSVFTNWIFGKLEITWGFFYFLKEIEFFFLYFYLFYHLKSIKSVKFIVGLWVFIGLIQVSWIIYEIVAGVKLAYYYGPTTFIEPRGPLPSGGFFLILFVFLLNIFIFHYLNLDVSKFKKIILGLIIISLVSGILVSGSRTSFWGMCFALLLTFFFYFLRKKKFKSFLTALLIIVFLLLIFFELSSLVPVVKRPLNLEGFKWQYFSGHPYSRIGIFYGQLKEIRSFPLSILFGSGVVGEAHSNLMRVLLERGIVGIFAFLLLMGTILRKSFFGFLKGGDSFSVGLANGLFTATAAMLLMSVSGDPFMVVKVAEVYWFFVAVTMAVLTKKLNFTQYGVSNFNNNFL